MAILDHPSHQTNIQQIGTAHETIYDENLSITECLQNLTQEKDPVLIYPSKVSNKVNAIHNVLDLGSNRIHKQPNPFAVMGFGTFATPVTFNPNELLSECVSPRVPSTLETLLSLDNIQKLKRPPGTHHRSHH